MKPMNEAAIEVIPANPEMVCKEIESERRRTEIRCELTRLHQKQTELILTIKLFEEFKRELETKITSASSQQEENENRIRQLDSELQKLLDHSNGKDDKTRAAGLKKTEETMTYVKSLMNYEAPDHAKDKKEIVILPLENGTTIPSAMYVQLITKVPEGKITCWKDINVFLGKMYKKDVPSYMIPSLPLRNVYDEKLPYWRVVSARGVLGNGINTPEIQHQHLIQEGLRVVQRGSMKGSYRVEKYKDHMFHFEELKVITNADYDA